MWPGVSLMGVDLAPACDGPGSVLQMDLFDCDPSVCSVSLVLGNPDYAIAEKAVRHCMSLLAPGGHLAFLLRLAFLGGAGRVQLYRDHPLRYLQPVAQRPSFTGGGSDPMEYGLFVWARDFEGGHLDRGQLLPPLVWR